MPELIELWGEYLRKLAAAVDQKFYLLIIRKLKNRLTFELQINLFSQE